MNKIIAKIVLLLSALSLCMTAEAASVHLVKVPSKSMSKNIDAIVITPDIMAEGQKCPVVYLLHGAGDQQNKWLVVKPQLPQIADREGIIFVLPDAKRSWYWDSPIDPSYKYETFVSKELVKFIDQNYLTLADRGHRAIAGLSMGGHGAMWLAIRHKNTFGACGSMSGGLDIRPFPEKWDMYKRLGKFSENKEIWDSHTVINQLETLKNGELAIVIDCGYDDFFFEVNENVHKKLLDLGIDHDYQTRPGAHNNKFWANALDYQLLFFTKFFQLH